MALIDRLNAIGDAIREKNGTTEKIPLVDMPQAIRDIVSGGDVSGGGNELAVEYIESTGTQYIDTGIVLKNGYVIEIDFQLTSTKAETQMAFGVVDNNDYLNGCFAGVVNNGFYGQASFSYSQTSLYHRTIAVGTTKRDYVNTAYVFARNWDVPWDFASMKLFSCKIYDNNGNIIQWLLPAVDENDIACLYDKVTGTYFYNQGEGNFEVSFFDDRLDEIETLIDESGVLEDTDGTVKEKVQQLLDLIKTGGENVG